MVIYVEDDKNLRELTVYALTQSGIEATGAASDAELRRLCTQMTPDALLLDIMLPDASGLDILARIRSSASLANIPVMMLTAKDSELDIVRALDAGADDYLTKPFGMLEMVSRVRALMRRSSRQAQGTPGAPGALGPRGARVKGSANGAAANQADPNFCLSVGEVCLWPARREVTAAGLEVQLTAREFDLLAFLMQAEGVVFSRETLLQKVWGWDFDGGSRTVDVHIQQLRAKLGQAASQLETVRGVGYRIR